MNHSLHEVVVVLVEHMAKQEDLDLLKSPW